MLTANVKTERMDVNHAWYGDDFCVLEHQFHGAVPGEFLGVPGHGRRVSFRMPHVWEFEYGRMSRENVWLDGGAIIAQLTRPRAPQCRPDSTGVGGPVSARTKSSSSSEREP